MAAVPDAILRRLRVICLDLPDAYEEAAWTGVRWMVRKKSFAHVLMIEGGWPPAYAAAAGTAGPACVLTFRTPHGGPRWTRAPFFRPVWFPDIVGLVLDEATDDDELRALIARSYCHLAPRSLAARVELV